jgi:CubicO group peptidase (beta-lactamase class C family)
MMTFGSGSVVAEGSSQRPPGDWGGLGADLDGHIRTVMGAWGVPGLAVAVVKDGKTFGAAYGAREVGRPEPVDIDTIFGIGSVTKTFTGLDVALLADRGLIDWDAPINRYLPDLRYADAETTARATVRDLAAHRVGVDSDLAWMVRSDPFEGCCQSKVNRSPLGRSWPKPDRRLARDCPPLSQGGRASLLVGFAADEVTLLTEVVVEGRVDRGELLQRLHPPEPQHRPLSSSEGLV